MRDAARSGGGVSSSASWARPVGRNLSWTAARRLPRFQPLAHFLGDERGDPHAVGVGEPQLRTGMRAFLAQDQPGAGRPRRHVEEVGGLGHPRPVADLTVRLDRRVPGLTAVEGVGRVLHPGVDRVAQREPDPWARQAVANAWVAPAASDRTSTFGAPGSRPGRQPGGSDANACSRTVT